MVSFDTVAFIIIGLSILYSVWKGMVREAFSLVALVAAYLVAINMYSNLAGVIGGIITQETLADVVSFIVLFLAGLLLVALMGRIAKKFLHASHAISGWDRFLGGFFGMAKGVLLLIVFMFPLQWFDETYARWTEDSLVAPYLEGWVNDIRENVELEPGFTRTLPGSLKGARQMMPSLEGIKERMSEQKAKLQKKVSSLSEKNKEIQEPGSSLSDSDMPPQEDYTEKDREQLEQILNQIEQKSGDDQ